MNGLTHLQAQFLLRSGEVLDAAAQASLEAHLGRCTECRGYASLIRHLEQALPLQEAAAAAARSAHPSASDRSARSYNSTQNRSKSMYRTFKSVWSTMIWLGLMVLMTVGIGWSIRHFLPAAQSGGGPTETPTASLTATAPETQPLISTSSTPAPGSMATETLVPGTVAVREPDYPLLSTDNVDSFGPLMQIELDNGEWPSSLAWSADGRALALHTQSEVLVYLLDDPATPVLRWTAQGSLVAYSSNGRWLANDVVSESGVLIELHDPASGAEIGSLPLPPPPNGGHAYCTALAFSPDSASLAVVCDGKVVVWDTAGQAVRWQTGMETDAAAISSALVLAFSPDGNELAVSGWQMPPTVYAVDSGEQIRQLESDSQEIRALVYAPDGAWIAGADGRDGVVRVWERATGKQLLEKLPGVTSWMENLAVSPQGVLLGSLQDDRLLAWDIPSGELLRAIDLDAGMIMQMAFSPDGSRMASTDNWRPVVRLWAVMPQAGAFPTDLPPTPVPEGNGKVIDYPTIVFGLDWAAQAERLLANTTKGIYVYETTNLQPVFSLANPDYLYYSVAVIDPAGQRLAIASDNWEIWDLGSGQKTATLGPVDQDGGGVAVFSPDGTQLAIVDQDGVLVWDLPRNLHRRLPIEIGARGVAFRPDGKTLLALTADGILQTWDLESAEVTASADVGLAFQFRFSPQAAWLAIQRKGGVEVWNTATGQKQTTFANCGSDIWYGAFDAAGQRLLAGPCMTGGQTMQAALFPAAGGEALLTLTDFVNMVEWRSAAINPAGRLLALGNSQGQIQFFDASNGQSVGAIQVNAP